MTKHPPPSVFRALGHPIRVAIADDHPLLLAGLAHELMQLPGVVVVGRAHNSSELVDLLTSRTVDVVMTDYSMPGGAYGDGLTLFSFLKQRYPSIPLIVLTMMSNPAIIRTLLAHGIQRILSKADSLVYVSDALHAAISSRRYLSPGVDAIVKMHSIDGDPNTSPMRKLSARELEVVRLFVAGLSVGEIAARLHRSKQTISTQKMSAMRRLGIKRDSDLILYGLEANLATPAINTIMLEPIPVQPV
jgi:two-component system, NarL family, captular synthesis response regulator RcsB